MQKTNTVKININADLYEWYSITALEIGVSISALIVLMLRDAMELEKKNDKLFFLKKREL